MKKNLAKKNSAVFMLSEEKRTSAVRMAGRVISMLEGLDQQMIQYALDLVVFDLLGPAPAHGAEHAITTEKKDKSGGFRTTLLQRESITIPEADFRAIVKEEYAQYLKEIVTAIPDESDPEVKDITVSYSSGEAPMTSPEAQSIDASDLSPEQQMTLAPEIGIHRLGVEDLPGEEEATEMARRKAEDGAWHERDWVQTGGGGDE